MKYTKQMRIVDFYNRMQRAGFTYDAIETLRRAEMTLSRWSEHECNGEIERDGITGKPFRVYRRESSVRRHPIADRESGALKRVSALMQAHPDWVVYHQTDPRGCALYVVSKSDIREGERLDAVYSRGLACNY